MDTALNQQFADSRGMPPAYDGITEAWWNAIEDLVEGMFTPVGKDAYQKLLEDEKDFSDFKNSYIFITEEYIIFDKT